MRRDLAAIVIGFALSMMGIALPILEPNMQYWVAEIIFGIGAILFIVGVVLLLLSFNKNKTKKDRKQQKDKVPTLRIRDFGNAPKTLSHDVWDTDFVEKRITLSREVTGEFDTLFIEVFNKQSEVGAERVWSVVEWINDKNEVLLHHCGRWLIPTETMKNEKVKENLQYRDLNFEPIPSNDIFRVGICRSQR